MNKILCPTDLSQIADNAIVYAAKLAQKFGARLDLFNVQSLSDLTPEEALVGQRLNVAAVKTRLEERCKEVSNVFKISCYGDVETSFGSINSIIGTRAKDYDLIVMGTNGPDDLLQSFLGSNTYQVIRKSSVPVWLVPENCGYRDIISIVYAFDYWRGNRLPMDQLLKLTKALGSELTVLEVMEKSVSRKAEVEVNETQKMLLYHYKDEISLKFDTIYCDKLLEGIHQYVAGKQADLLALCTENHGFLQRAFHKSVVKAVTATAACPVFVFHR